MQLESRLNPAHMDYVEGFFLCFYLWCKFSFLLSLGMIIYNSEFKINEFKFKPSKTIIHV